MMVLSGLALLYGAGKSGESYVDTYVMAAVVLPFSVGLGIWCLVRFKQRRREPADRTILNVLMLSTTVVVSAACGVLVNIQLTGLLGTVTVAVMEVPNSEFPNPGWGSNAVVQSNDYLQTVATVVATRLDSGDWKTPDGRLSIHLTDGTITNCEARSDYLWGEDHYGVTFLCDRFIEGDRLAAISGARLETTSDY